MKKVIEGKIIRLFRSFKDQYTKTTVLHQGVDIATEIGTPVFTPLAGIVRSVHQHREAGLTVVIVGGGKRLGFCHLDSTDLKVGDKVAKGQEIARAGSSGVCDRPHLHFSVMEGGRWVKEHEVVIPTDDDNEFDAAPTLKFKKAHYAGGHYVNPLQYLMF